MRPIIFCIAFDVRCDVLRYKSFVHRSHTNVHLYHPLVFSLVHLLSYCQWGRMDENEKKTYILLQICDIMIIFDATDFKIAVSACDPIFDKWFVRMFRLISITPGRQKKKISCKENRPVDSDGGGAHKTILRRRIFKILQGKRTGGFWWPGAHKTTLRRRIFKINS